MHCVWLLKVLWKFWCVWFYDLCNCPFIKLVKYIFLRYCHITWRYYCHNWSLKSISKVILCHSDGCWLFEQISQIQVQAQVLQHKVLTAYPHCGETAVSIQSGLRLLLCHWVTYCRDFHQSFFLLPTVWWAPNHNRLRSRYFELHSKFLWLFMVETLVSHLRKPMVLSLLRSLRTCVRNEVD